EQTAEEGRERSMFRELGLEVAQLFLVRKLAVEKQVRDLFVLRLPDQLFDPVAPVLEKVVGNRADRRGRRDNALKTLGGGLWPFDCHRNRVSHTPRQPGSGASPMVREGRTCERNGAGVKSRPDGSGGLYRPGRTKQPS